jgi:hypothetical protein
MNDPIVPLDLPSAGPNPEAVSAALAAAPLPPEDTAPAPAPEGPTGPGPVDTDAEKLARAKPGRKRSPISKHRTKPELLQAARAQEEEIQRLKALLGEKSDTGPAPELGTGPALTPDEVRRAVSVAFEATVELASKMLAAYRGPHWELTDPERECLRDAWVPLLAHYAPALGQSLPWLGAVSTTALVVMPRLGRDAELAAQRAGPVAPMAAPAFVPAAEVVEAETPQVTTAGRHVGGPV